MTFGHGQKLVRASYFVRILGLYTETLSRVFFKSNIDNIFVAWVKSISLAVETPVLCNLVFTIGMKHTRFSPKKIMNNVWLSKNSGGQSSRSPEPWSHHDKVQVNRYTELDWVILNRLEFLWLNPSIFQKFVLYFTRVLWVDVENEFIIQATHKLNWKKKCLLWFDFYFLLFGGKKLICPAL